MTSPSIVKVCGINDTGGLDAALDAGADMVGFVFFSRSPRNISLDLAQSLSRRAAHRSKKVALTVDASDATLRDICAALDPDLFQLHGSETPARVAEIRVRFDRPVLRALPIADVTDLEAIVAFDAVADYLLFDARPPSGAERPGGHGAVFDWSLLRGVDVSRPWLLAGGLTEVNVLEALSATGATGVDVSSGVESVPGRKDPAKIARFVARARAAMDGRVGNDVAIG